MRELGELDKLASRFSTVIVYGPRGVGKSELTRYWISKRGYRASMSMLGGSAYSLAVLLREPWAGVLLRGLQAFLQRQSLVLGPCLD